jgi:hypothetical protein
MTINSSPQQDARKALIDRLNAEARYLSDGPSYSRDVLATLMRQAVEEIEALSESSASSETPHVDISKLTTTMVEFEWQEALKWRERFLDYEGESEGNPPLRQLAPQIVCYLVADCMTMREFHDAHEAKSASSETQEERSDGTLRDRWIAITRDMVCAHSYKDGSIAYCEPCFFAALETLLGATRPVWEWYANRMDGGESWRCLRCRRVTTFFGSAEKRCPTCDAQPSPAQPAETPEERKDVAPEMPGVPPVNLMAALRQALNNAYAKPAAPRSTREEDGR